jgi:hypothetical protein
LIFEVKWRWLDIGVFQPSTVHGAGLASGDRRAMLRPADVRGLVRILPPNRCTSGQDW